MRRSLSLLSCAIVLGCSGSSGADDPDGGSDAARDAAVGDTGPLDGGPGDPTTCAEPKGRFGAPTVTYELAVNTSDGGLYVKDVVALLTEKGIDPQKLDRLYLKGGRYAFVYLGNLPKRTRDKPLVITNRGGQVKIGGLRDGYVLSLNGGSGWVLTGRSDPASQTGDPAFPGHEGCRYAGSRDTYGILSDDEFRTSGSFGIGVGAGATDFELEFLEIRRSGFAGVVLKTDKDPTATMRNVSLHDLYVHDTGGEGTYIGSTQFDATKPSGGEHAFTGLRVFRNRFLRTATESFQIGMLGDDCEVHHNVMALGALGWRFAFQQYQDTGVQYGARYGRQAFHHNVVVGAAALLFNFFPQPRDGDPHTAGDQVSVSDNYFGYGLSGGGYVQNASDKVTAYRFERNFLGPLTFRYAELYDAAKAPTSFFYVNNSESKVSFVDNQLSGTLALVNKETGNVSVSGTKKVALAPPPFRDFLGLPRDLDYRRVELWGAEATLGKKGPITFTKGDYVMHKGELYELLAATSTNQPPDTNPSVWKKLPPPPDDVRLEPGSPYEGLGL